MLKLTLSHEGCSFCALSFKQTELQSHIRIGFEKGNRDSIYSTAMAKKTLLHVKTARRVIGIP